jgi:hypothetical protein
MLTAGPVSKMASQQEKAFCVLRFEVFIYVITVQREFSARFRTAGSACATNSMTFITILIYFWGIRRTERHRNHLGGIAQSLYRLAMGWTVLGSNPEVFHTRYTGAGTQPASYTIGSGPFPAVKRPRFGVDHPTPSSAEVKESVEPLIL